jgi:hypothetical protein
MDAHPVSNFKYRSCDVLADLELKVGIPQKNNEVALYSGTKAYKKVCRSIADRDMERQRLDLFIQSVEKDQEWFAEDVWQRAQNRFVVGKQSTVLGWVGPDGREGDLIYLIQNAKMPIVIRMTAGRCRFIAKRNFL